MTQTHDTKRSGDVRARIGALAGMADELAVHVRRWLNVSRSLTSGGAPTPVEQYFIFQTLLGAWPISAERLAGYLEKAMREAKQHTNWIEPDERHEAAVQRFAARAARRTASSCATSSPSSAASPRPATAPRSASCC